MRLKILLVSTVISTSEGLSTKEAGVVFVGKIKKRSKEFSVNVLNYFG